MASFERTPVKKPAFINGGVWDLDDMPQGAALEPRIKPLVERMHATGHITTVASCEGHGWRARGPYVDFRTDVAIASAIERRLREADLSDELRLYWWLTARFDPEFRLRYSLRSTVLDRAADAGWMVCLPLCKPWTRRAVDRELLLVARHVEEAVRRTVRPTA